MEKATTNFLFQIGSGFRKCLSLWREIQGICQGRTSLDNIIRDMSESLEATLQSGQTSVEQTFQIIPVDKRAFDYGDDTSHKELSNVIAKQRILATDLENIKGQLSFYFQQQQASPTQRSARNTVRKPESLLDINTMVRITESVFDHINSTSAALINLAQRVEAKHHSRLDPKQSTSSSSSFKSSPSINYPPSPQSSFASRSSPSVHESPKFKTPEKLVTQSDYNFTPNPPLPTRPQAPPPAYESPRPKAQESPLAPLQSRPKAPERTSTPIPMDLPPRSPVPARCSDPAIITKAKAQSPRESSTATNNTPAPPPPGLISNTPGTYCTGALRLQHNPNLRIKDILLLDSPHAASTQPVCKYCNLELDIYPWDENSMAEHWQDCTEAASQHILMCASLVERNAMFRCLACERQNHPVDAEFRSAKDFMEHRRTH